MQNPRESREEFAQRGREYYNRFLRDKLEPEHKGKYLVLDVQSGEYETDADDMTAIRRARARMPEAIFYILRVGYPTAYRFGARSKWMGA
jgi:hypothetical protein